jgi:ribosome-associated protein
MRPAPGLFPPPYHTDRASLEREVVIERLRVRGPGGQHRNVTESAVRLTHLPSGVRVVATESRSQHRNREAAFERLIARLERLNRVPVPRVPTRSTRAAKERRLREKKRRQTAKRLRGAVRGESD